MTTLDELSDKQAEIREHYAEVARSSDDACSASRGCGKPIDRAALQPGETVLDLGCGAGKDVFEAASLVEASGHIYGLDMTPEMLALAERTAQEEGIDNVSFLQGFIEEIPLPDNSVDVVTSNCVLNLSDDKKAALREMYRVLKPGGRFVIADIVLLDDTVPEFTVEMVAPIFGCINGVLAVEPYGELLSQVGFSELGIDIYQRFSVGWLARRAEKRGQGRLLSQLDPDLINNAFAAALLSGIHP
jgi:ubiquinone/menaquinone biosynthesis C-methylase UbiE